MIVAASPAPSHVLASHLGDETVLLDLSTKRYHLLNATASQVWRGLEAGLTGESLVAWLSETFDGDASVVRADVERLLGELRAAGLLADGAS